MSGGHADRGADAACAANSRRCGDGRDARLDVRAIVGRDRHRANSAVGGAERGILDIGDRID